MTTFTLDNSNFPMIDFSINFANDAFTPADFSYGKNFFGHAGFVLEKMVKHIYIIYET